MARLQVLTTNAALPVPVAGTPVPLMATQTFVKSVIIQADPTNTDFVYVGNATIQNYGLSPGKSVEIHGDNMDNGTSGKLDLNTIYVDSLVNGEGVTFMYLDRI